MIKCLVIENGVIDEEPALLREFTVEKGYDMYSRNGCVGVNVEIRGNILRIEHRGGVTFYIKQA